MVKQGMIADSTDCFSDSVDTSLLVMGTTAEPMILNNPYYFPSDTLIDSQKVVGIAVTSRSQNPILPNGSNNVSSDDVFRHFLLTLVGGDGKEIYAIMPLSMLLDVQIGNGYAKTPMFSYDDIVWDKCYVQCIDTTAGGININDTNILFKIYTKPKD